MITERQIEIANMILSSKLVKNVFHSVELFKSDKGTVPVYKDGTEERYIGPDDSKEMFAYIRQKSAVTVKEEKRAGSDSKMYRLNIPTRIVFFKDNDERDFDTLTSQLLKVVFMKDVSLVSFNHNAFQLAAEESTMGDFDFTSKTFYAYIDVVIKMWLNDSDCAVNNCIVHPNPICKS